MFYDARHGLYRNSRMKNPSKKKEITAYEKHFFSVRLHQFLSYYYILMTENNLYIPSSIATQLPSMVRNELAKLPAQKQEEFIEEYKRKSKSLAIAYIFLLIIC